MSTYDPYDAAYDPGSGVPVVDTRYPRSHVAGYVQDGFTYCPDCADYVGALIVCKSPGTCERCGVTVDPPACHACGARGTEPCDTPYGPGHPLHGMPHAVRV